MNKFYKIVLISIIFVLVGTINFLGVSLAQESSLTPLDNSNQDTKESPQTNNVNPNPRFKNKDLEKKSSPTDTKDISSKASEKRNENVDKRELNLAERAANREQRIKDRCELVGSRILKHQENFTSQSQTRFNKYNKITTRLEAVSTSLIEKGVDVSVYNSYITELKSKIIVLSTLNQDYIQLFGSKANTGEFCNNKEQLVAEIQDRKSKLQLVIAKDKEIKIYIRDTILPYLKSIKTESNNNNNNN